MNLFNISEKSAKMRKVLRSRGIGGTLKAAARYAFPAKAKSFAKAKEVVEGRQGLEIGGPSPGFGRKGFLPIYPFAKGIDNCNFGAKTVWEGSISDGLTFQFDPNRPKGRQYIAEATDLRAIPDKSYDFVLSCHSIEHTANPLLALEEWKRVLREEGGMVLVVPHKEDTFDHRRPVTALEHIIADFKVNVGEDDTTHVLEVLELHDFDKDWGTMDFNAFKRRCHENFETRCLHHHVFSTSLVVQMLDYARLQIRSVEALMPFHIIVVARKLPPGVSPRNEPFLSPKADWLRTSPFKIDRDLRGNEGKLANR